MKITKSLILFLSILTSCCPKNSYNTNLVTSENMLMFDNCYLLFRGIDDFDNNLYILQIDTPRVTQFVFLHAWYKDSLDCKLSEMNSNEFDTSLVMDILNSANKYNIREIHPLKNNSIGVYLKFQENPIIVQFEP